MRKDLVQKTFGAYRAPSVPFPDLVGHQQSSFAWLLKHGFAELFKEFSPITDYSGKKFELRFESFEVGEPKFDEEFARENQLVPLLRDGDVLSVAFARPDNILAQENLKVLTGLTIQVFVATKTEVLKAVDALYARGTDLIGKTISQASDEEGGEVPSADVRVDLDRSAISSANANSVNLVNAILKQAIHERCSDIHIEAYEDDEVILRFRIDGLLHLRTPPPRQSFPAVVSRIKILSRLDIAERRLPQDGAFSFRSQNRVIDARVSICPAAFGEKIVVRLLDKNAISLDLETLGLEAAQLADFVAGASQPHGLVLLTGPTGSGKTSTLYALLNRIKTPNLNFLTIEDPIEIKLRGISQVQVQSGIGLTFASALRSFLRQDPDVILVGEVRDKETAETCLRAAMTGHLVLSTLHTNDALSSVLRLVDLGVEPFLLASSLAVVAAQRLVRVLCPACRKPYRPDPPLLARCCAEGRFSLDPSQAVFYAPGGCPECAKTGYRGRTVVAEIYRVDDGMREIIYRHSGDLGTLKEAAAKAGKPDLRAAAWRKVARGVTSVEEILAATV
jgi:type IV pilus assembly protein PilB